MVGMSTNNTVIRRYVLLFLMLGFITSNSLAQFTFSGEVRPRTEYRHGYKSLPAIKQDNAIYTDQRTRLNAGFKGEGFETFIQFQDIRTWGSTSQLNTIDGFTSLHQAWAIAKIRDKFSFKFGRQEIILDDHRIFGSVAWTQQARSHDAGIFRYMDSTFTLNVGLAFNQDKPQLTTTLYTVAKNYKAMQYVWLNKVFSKSLSLSVLFLNNGQQVTVTDPNTGGLIARDNYSQTMGATAKFNKDKLSGRATFYYQTGVNGDLANTKIAAYDARFELAYKLSDKFSVDAGVELLSGTSQTDTSSNKKLGTFNPFYGTNHKFNGYMDYFYVGNYTGLGSPGLNDIFVGAGYKNGKKYFVKGQLHFFLAASDVLDVTELANTGLYTAMGSSLGQELDITFGFPLSKGVALQGGYSILNATETMVALKGGAKNSVSSWGYIMLTVKPNFIGGKK